MNQFSHRSSWFCAASDKKRIFRTAAFLLFLVGLSVAPSASAQATNKEAQIKIFTGQMNWAIQKVQKIVNQPVTQLPRTPGMDLAWYPSWFHEGANKPDFDHVDVRTTQETPYKSEYCGSDLNPEVVFVGRELEFNSNLKYFYTDRSVPKKKLTLAEMLEINRLYRIIGNDERQIARLQIIDPTVDTRR